MQKINLSALDTKRIYDLYFNKHKSIAYIVKELDYKGCWVRAALREMGGPRTRSQAMRYQTPRQRTHTKINEIPSDDILHLLYVKNRYSIRKIVAMFIISDRQLTRRLRELGILRNPSQAARAGRLNFLAGVK